MENIAAAAATVPERRVAVWIALAVVGVAVATGPVASVPLPEAPAILPAIVSIAVVAQVVTAFLFFVQWRITLQAQLAILAIAFVADAVGQTAWLLVYPGVFAPHGMLGAGAHTVGWVFFVDNVVFGALLIAYGSVERFKTTLSRRSVRTVGAVSFAVLGLGIGAAIVFGDVLPATFAGRDFTPMFRGVIAPLLLAEYVAAVLLLAARRVRTVAHLWLLVVCLAKCAELLTSNLFSAQRFSVGWYAGRGDDVIASIVILCVFLYKLNELLVRLATRNQSLTERTESDALAIAAGEERYRSLTNAIPQLIWSSDARGSFEYVNERWIAYVGLDETQSRNGGWLRAVHPDDQATVRERWEAALGGGEPFAMEYRLRHAATGRYRWFLVNALATRDARGEILRWTGTSTDIDDAKRLEEREGLLSSASDRLSASLDVMATLDTLKELVLPRLCDWCQIDLIDEDGRFVPTAVGSAEPADEELLATLLGRPVEGAAQSALERIVSRGEPVIVDAPNVFAETLPNARDRAVYQRVRAGAAIVLPLTNGDERIGVLSLVFAHAHTVSADEVAFARDFARRAALALGHARLYERERTTADALQRAMLPAQLPLLENLKFSASYSAASESQRVGGDFYDAFALPDGRVAVTIGDVTGHGLEAAVIMGEIRQALRAAAFERAEPSAILDRASRLLVASGRTVFVTAIFGVLDTVTGRFAYATAGHPPPLLYDGTRLTKLASSGLPIGLREDDGVDFALNLHAPCTLVLFTDGLLEFGRDLNEGERRIEAAIRELSGTETDHLAAAIMKRVLGKDEATDDIAVLTATCRHFAEPIPGDEREWRFLSADARAAALVRREIGDLVAAARPAERFAAELAFGELIANAVRHAPGPVVARCRIALDGAATIELDDMGVGFVPAARTVEPLAESGRGLALLHSFADEVRIGRGANGGASVLVRLNGQPSDPPSRGSE